MVLLLWLLIVTRFGRYLSPKQAGEAYPVLGERHIRRLIADQRLPYSKVGSKVLIAEEDIEALIRAGRVEPRGRALRAV